MLSRLSIRDIVLIDRLDIDFAPGLAVLTGEIEMSEPADVVGERRSLSFHFVHCVRILRSSCPAKAGHPVFTE